MGYKTVKSQGRNWANFLYQNLCLFSQKCPNSEQSRLVDQYGGPMEKEAELQNRRAHRQRLRDIRAVQPAWYWYHVIGCFASDFPGRACLEAAASLWGLANWPVVNICTAGILFVVMISKSAPLSAMYIQQKNTMHTIKKHYDLKMQLWESPKLKHGYGCTIAEERKRDLNVGKKRSDAGVGGKAAYDPCNNDDDDCFYYYKK